MSNVLIFNAKDEIRKLTSMNFTETNAVVIHVDREVADFLLSKNFDANRGVRSSRVAFYRRTMLDGAWTVGDPIKMSVEGELLDGQHRLNAVPPGLVIPFVILTGQPKKAAETYDQGMQRNALHIAQIRGMEGIGSTHISALRMMFVFRICASTTTGLSNFASPQKLISILEKYPEIKSAIDFGLRYSGRTYGIRFAPFTAAIARAKLSDCPLSDQDLDFFMHVLHGELKSTYQGVTARKESAPLALRNSHFKINVNGKTSDKRFDEFYRAQSALLAFQQNEDVKLLKPRMKNVFPVPFIDFMNLGTLDYDESLIKKAG